ncbi:MAG: hypothetical protein ACI3V5_09305 [Faecousia sp.]
MAASQNFRSAFNGFNREDVVRYLEYINTKHQNQINELTAEADNLRKRLENLQNVTARDAERDAELEAQLAAVTEERDALRAQVEQMQSPAPAAEPQPEEAPAAGELDAYRRAERIERNARERSELIYHQASGVLSEAITKVDAATGEITSKADEAMSQLTQLQMAVSASKQALQDAASLMNTIRPNF